MPARLQTPVSLSTAPHAATGGRLVAPRLGIPEECLAAHDRLTGVMAVAMLDIGRIVGQADHETRGLRGKPIPPPESLKHAPRQGPSCHSRPHWLKPLELRGPYEC